MQFKALQLADAALSTEINPFRRKKLCQQVCKQLTPYRRTQCRELNHQPTIVPVDGATREAVRFAEREPAALAGATEPEHRLTQAESGLQP